MKGEKGRQAETLARRARAGSFCARRSNDPLAERGTRSRARGRISFCIYLYKNRSAHGERGAVVGTCRGGKIENKKERTCTPITDIHTHIHAHTVAPRVTGRIPPRVRDTAFSAMARSLDLAATSGDISG